MPQTPHADIKCDPHLTKLTCTLLWGLPSSPLFSPLQLCTLPSHHVNCLFLPLSSAGVWMKWRLRPQWSEETGPESVLWFQAQSSFAVCRRPAEGLQCGEYGEDTGGSSRSDPWARGAAGWGGATYWVRFYSMIHFWAKFFKEERLGTRGGLICLREFREDLIDGLWHHIAFSLIVLITFPPPFSFRSYIKREITMKHFNIMYLIKYSS